MGRGVVPARIPRKLLLFDDHARVKYVSYRSVPISLDRLAELSELRFRDVWLSRRIWKCVPLALGLLAPGLYLRRDDGWAYFFNVRDRDELVRLAADEEATVEARAGAEWGLGRIAVAIEARRPGSPQEEAHDALAAADITRFLERRDAGTERSQTLTAPRGTPIGGRAGP